MVNKSDPEHPDSDKYYTFTYGDLAMKRLKEVRKRWAERHGQ